MALTLSSRPESVEVVGVCSVTGEALECVRRHPDAVVLVDMGTGDGIGATRRISAEAQEATLLAFAIEPESEGDVVAAAEAGIMGYVPPEASLQDLIDAVEYAARGEMLCSPRVAGTLARRLALLASGRPGRVVEAAALTARELEVLERLETGLSNKQIARLLSIRPATVKNHVHSILAKLNVSSRGEAVAALRGETSSGLSGTAPFQTGRGATVASAAEARAAPRRLRLAPAATKPCAR